MTEVALLSDDMVSFRKETLRVRGRKESIMHLKRHVETNVACLIVWRQNNALLSGN